jgi:glutamyl-tRNA synthetase
VSPDGADPVVSHAAAEALGALETWDAASIEQTLRELAEAEGMKPREAFAPIRLAVTGSKVSPSLFESLELLGREETLARLQAAP